MHGPARHRAQCTTQQGLPRLHLRRPRPGTHAAGARAHDGRIPHEFRRVCRRGRRIRGGRRLDRLRAAVPARNPVVPDRKQHSQQPAPRVRGSSRVGAAAPAAGSVRFLTDTAFEAGSGVKSGSKRKRQARLLRIIREHRVPHQEALRARLAAEGFAVAQATLSRDIRDLRLVKVVGADGKPHYTLPEEWENIAPLDAILPALFVSAEPVGNLIVVRTLSGAAQAVASGIDWE
ncbi:MAG: hypothetical protein F4Y21_05660 [Gemmatimonadetes bacterium]|nr:hypothetical protein [Gemmatimonadota bacterium]